MHDICSFVKNPCRENLYSAKCEQFMCAKNPCFTVAIFPSQARHGAPASRLYSKKVTYMQFCGVRTDSDYELSVGKLLGIGKECRHEY